MRQSNAKCRMLNAEWAQGIGYVLSAAILMLAGAGLHALVLPQKPAPGGYIIEHDADIAKNEPGTHNGGGQTVGYSFFSKVPNLKLIFRKRALKPGSDDAGRQHSRDHAGHRRSHAHRQLAQPEAGWR